MGVPEDWKLAFLINGITSFERMDIFNSLSGEDLL